MVKNIGDSMTRLKVWMVDIHSLQEQDGEECHVDGFYQPTVQKEQMIHFLLWIINSTDSMISKILSFILILVIWCHYSVSHFQRSR